MAITHNGVAMFSNNGPPQPGPVDGLLTLGHWPGVVGETHQLSGPHGREIRIECDFYGFATQALLQAAIDVVASASYVRTGTLVVDGVTFANCTFLGFEEHERYLDGSGVYGWRASGMATWRQAANS